jgi:hypothetical protein
VKIYKASNHPFFVAFRRIVPRKIRVCTANVVWAFFVPIFVARGAIFGAIAGFREILQILKDAQK